MSICSFAERVAQTRKIPKYYKEALASHVQVGNQRGRCRCPSRRGRLHPTYKWEIKDLVRRREIQDVALASHVQVGNQSVDHI